MKKLVSLFLLSIIFSIYLVSAWDSGLNTNIIAYWNFDKNSSDMVGSHDFSEASGNLTPYLDSTGIINYSYFMGDAGYKQLTVSSEDFDFNGDSTLNVWINVAVTGEEDFMGTFMDGYGWLLYESGGKFAFYGNSGDVNINGGTDVIENTWYMITVVQNSSGITLLLNGNEEGYSSGVLNQGGSLLSVSKRNTSGVYNGYFNGWIDEMGYWNRELNVTEIQGLYNSGVGETYPIIPSLPTIDNITVAITYPQNTSYNSLKTALNYTVGGDLSGDVDCWYSLNNGLTNSSEGDCNNFIGLTSHSGSNKWTVYVEQEDTSYINSSSVTFYIDNEYPQLSGFTEVPISNSNYSNSTIYEFNVTLISTNETRGIEFAGTNYSLTKNNHVYSFYITNLTNSSNYTYYYWAYGNGTLKNYAKSSTFIYSVGHVILPIPPTLPTYTAVLGINNLLTEAGVGLGNLLELLSRNIFEFIFAFAIIGVIIIIITSVAYVITNLLKHHSKGKR